MRSLNKQEWLTALEERVESFVGEAAQTIQNLDEATLNRPAPTGGWSIAQCLAHLVSYGDYYVPHLTQWLAQPTDTAAPATFTPSWLGAYLNRLMDPAASRRTFRAARQHRPSDTLPAHEVVRVFIDQLEDLLRLLQLARNADVNTGRIPLSVARWVCLPPGDILQFMVTHTDRHLQQARRNR